MSYRHYTPNTVNKALIAFYSSKECADLKRAIDKHSGRNNAVSAAHFAAATTASHSKPCNPSGGRSKRAKRTRRNR